ncbi:hypothetical protein HK100_006791, partial [Physocladia obscura]
YAKQPWLVGANFLPSTASNQLEMFQQDSFNATVIARELAFAQKMGMNTMRVFLHDLLFKDDEKSFLNRFDLFLSICANNKIRPLVVFFDSCWDPYPMSGKQKDPIPGVHNSRWLKSPGFPALYNTSEYSRLEKYVRTIIRQHKDDSRILAWDLWNEPDCPQNAMDAIAPLLPQVFKWAREERPSQPLTSGVTFTNIDAMQLNESDIVSFHAYGDVNQFKERISKLKYLNRPILCTEWLGRPISLPEHFLPIAKKENVAMFNWGLVDGRMQTKFPWDSVNNPYNHEPNPWFHDLLYPDGSPYRQSEYELFKKLTN